MKQSPTALDQTPSPQQLAPQIWPVARLQLRPRRWMLPPYRRARFWKLLPSFEMKHHNPRRTSSGLAEGEAKEIEEDLVAAVDNPAEAVVNR